MMMRLPDISFFSFSSGHRIECVPTHPAAPYARDVRGGGPSGVRDHSYGRGRSKRIAASVILFHKGLWDIVVEIGVAGHDPDPPGRLRVDDRDGGVAKRQWCVAGDREVARSQGPADEAVGDDGQGALCCCSDLVNPRPEPVDSSREVGPGLPLAGSKCSEKTCSRTSE